MAKRIALVACVSMKQVYETSARELYCSPWFIKASAFAERTTECWFILSAMYGLVSPTRIIKPYDMTLKRMSTAQRKEWAGRVFDELCQALNFGDEVIFLTGAIYRENLLEPVKQLGCIVQVPMEGLAIGKQLSWLNRHLEANEQ